MMTRDAKIGLLVGLAFILIVGILLSEHITTATSPQQASLAQAGDRVRRGTDAPVAPQPAVVEAKVDPDPQPKQAVVTREQLDSPVVPPTTRIELGAPQNGTIKVIRVDQPSDPIASAQSVTTNEPTKTEQPKSSEPILAATHTPLDQLARQQGLELVAVGPNAGQPPVISDSRPTLPPITNGAKVREYVAKSGDSLSRIANRELGSNTPANRQLIVNLNPSLQKDSNRILVGATYLLPADPWAAALGVEPEAQPASAKQQPTKESAKEATKEAPKPTTNTVDYTVKSGDSLWKIADRECGNANAVAEIKKLNADVLGESEVVKVGMKLKLPKKQ